MFRFTVANFLREYPVNMGLDYHESLDKWLNHEDIELDRLRVLEILTYAYSELGGLPPVVDDFHIALCKEFNQ